MDTTKQEEAIARYNDGAMKAEAKSTFSNELNINTELRSEVVLENTIDRVLHTDALKLEHAISSDSLPAPAILDRLAATTAASKSRAGYYLFGSAAIIVGLFYVLLQPTEPTQPVKPMTPAAPAPQPITIEQPSQVPVQNIPIEEHTTIEPVKSPKTKPQIKKQPIDLDKDLQPPKVFTDPKAHMPIEKK